MNEDDVPIPLIEPQNFVVNVSVKVHDRSKTTLAETPTSSGICNALTNGILSGVYKKPTALVLCPTTVLEVDITSLILAGPDSVITHMRSLVRDHAAVSYAFMVAMPDVIYVFGQTRGQENYANIVSVEDDKMVVTTMDFKIPSSWGQMFD